MKNLMIALAVAFSSTSAFAADHSEISAAFMKAPMVATQIQKAKTEDLEVASTPDVALIGGGCGFAGCDEKFLVTLAVRTKGVNSQTSVISAIAVKLGYGGVSFEPANLSTLE